MPKVIYEYSDYREEVFDKNVNKNIVSMTEINGKNNKLVVEDGVAEGDGFIGTGTDPNTFAPIEFVVFNTDVLVLQYSNFNTPKFRYFL